MDEAQDSTSHAEVDGIDALRLARHGPEIRAKIGGSLTKLGALIARNSWRVTQQEVDYTAPNTRAVLLVAIGEGAPVVVGFGDLCPDDVHAAHLALYDYGTDHKGWGGNARVVKRWAERQTYRAEEELERKAKITKHPWQCEFCAQRYTSRGWAERHEAKCWRNPNAPMPGYEKTIQDGRVVGYHWVGQ